MASFDQCTEAPSPHRTKLESLKYQLERANADKARLEAAIAFLETTPGALALVESI